MNRLPLNRLSRINLLNRYEYIEYRTTAGYQKFKNMLTDNEVTNRKILLENGYQAVFFKQTHTGSNKYLIENLADCLVGIEIQKENIGYQLYFDDKMFMSGKSEKYRSTFTTGEQPVQSKYDSTENFRLNERDNIHADLVDDSLIVGRNYIPLIAIDGKGLTLTLDEPSEVTFRYMLLNDKNRNAFVKCEHHIEIYNSNYIVQNGNIMLLKYK